MGLTQKELQKRSESVESREARETFRQKRRQAEKEMKAPYAQLYPEAKGLLAKILDKQADGPGMTLFRLNLLREKYPEMVLPDNAGLHVNAFLAVPFRRTLISNLYAMAEKDGVVAAAQETAAAIQGIGFSCDLTARLYRHLHYFETSIRFERVAQKKDADQAAQCANHEAEEWTGPASRRNHLIKIAQRFIDLAF